MVDIQLSEIKRRVSLREVAERAGARFRGEAAACPLHGGDNPTAFRLYDEGRRWHCFTRCEEGENDGDLVAFYMRWKGVDFKTAEGELAVLAGLQAPVEGQARNDRLIEQARQGDPASGARSGDGGGAAGFSARAFDFLTYAREQLLHPVRGAAARAYLFSERGIDAETIEAFQLGLNPSDVYDEASEWKGSKWEFSHFEVAKRKGPTVSPANGKGKGDASRKAGGKGSGKIFLPAGIVIPRFLDGELLALKIRRPLPGDLLTDYFSLILDNESKQENSQSIFRPRSSVSKFHCVHGSTPGLFGGDLWIGHEALLLVEGEFDAMLCWRLGREVCDVATLGSAGQAPYAGGTGEDDAVPAGAGGLRPG